MKTKTAAKRAKVIPPPKTAKTRKKLSPRATVVSVDHAPGADPLQGSRERRTLLVSRALHYKTRGHGLLEIAGLLRAEFQLVETPAKATIHTWIAEALAENSQVTAVEASQYVAMVKERAEGIIKKLYPIAVDDFRVERIKIIDGTEVPVISERVFDERVKAAAEIRKQGESVLRAMGVFKAAPEGGENGMSGDGTRMFIIQTVNNHIARSGEVLTSDRSQTVLELESGDPVIDGL